jgi:hypothetical protein
MRGQGEADPLERREPAGCPAGSPGLAGRSRRRGSVTGRIPDPQDEESGRLLHHLHGHLLVNDLCEALQIQDVQAHLLRVAFFILRGLQDDVRHVL